jgi:hypothetical protein
VLRASFVAALAAAVVLAASCREPTQITVTITTDAKCADIDGVGVSVGVLGNDLENKPASALSLKCDDATGRIGTLVLVPSGSSNDEVAFRVTAGYGQRVDDCKPPFGKGCIVARRAIRYIPHTPLFVPVKLSVACNGVPCDPTQTCDNGACVDSRLDPNQCESPSGCDVSDAGTDATMPDGGFDAQPDAPPRDAGTPSAATIATVGNVPSATGTAQHQHIVYATHSGRWWMFTLADAAPTVLQSQWSTDFVTWTPAQGFTMSESSRGEARNFAVAYADVAGNDVVHIAYGHRTTGNPATNHVRATISGASIAYGTDEPVSSSNQWLPMDDPDGTNIALASDGHLFVATGWVNEKQFQGFDTTGNMDLYESTQADLGSGAGPITNYVLHSWVMNYDNTRALVPIESGGMLALFPLADSITSTSDISWAASKASWMTNATLFANAAPTSQNDWSVCGRTPTEVHAVRRLINSGQNDTYEHRKLDTTSLAWTTPPSTIPSESGPQDSGIVLLTNGTKLLLFAIDAQGAIRYATYAGSWSAWQTLFAPTAKRAFLSGSGCVAQGTAAITWTEGAAAPYKVMGAEVTKLF